MKRIALFSLLSVAAAGFSVPTTALAAGDHSATVCVALDGSTRAPTCRGTSTWRQDNLCSCPANTDQLKAPLCASGETPAPEGAKANEARHQAARSGNLMNGSYNGHRFCVRPEPMPR
jgi:hypothetical protein